MQKCYDRYARHHNWGARTTIEVMDIGGANVNGSYADIFSGPQFHYLAADLAPDENVDIVLEDPYKLPFVDGSIDLHISGQAFEHAEFFWLIFAEMVRTLAPDGLIFLIAPSGGPIHRYPVDCYRFYPDAYRALAKLTHTHLVDCWHDDRGPWNDLVGVFSKQPMEKYPATTQYTGNNWPPNRYEIQTAPNFTTPENPVPEEELTQGAVGFRNVLERLHKTISPASYLEIGVRSGVSLQLASCPAIGIEPVPELQVELRENHRLFEMTSDHFFEFEAAKAFVPAAPEFIFIDGMHLFEFAFRDFINVESYASPTTIVVVDDVLPNHVKQAERSRQTQVWTGDVWKLAHCLARYRPELNLSLLDTHPTGLLVISGLDQNNRVLKSNYNPIVRAYLGMELEGDHAAQVLQRSKAVDPGDGAFWDELKTIVASENLNSDGH